MDMDIDANACVPDVLHEGSPVLGALRSHVPGGPGTIASSTGG